MKKRTQLLLASAALAASYLYVRQRSAQAEAQLPPSGRFLDVDGVRLHYVERGAGPVVVLLHGNGALAQDFENCGLVAELARHYRVIAFDRPGYGYSDRPRDRLWTPEHQAELLLAALCRLNVSNALVLGHSWGAMVALAMGLRNPGLVRGLVLLAGYYYPSVRADVLLQSGPAIPVLGDAMRFTLSPLVSRMLWPLFVRRMFSPCGIDATFRRLPKWLTLRPLQLRASAAESAMMIPAAAGLMKKYAGLTMPVALLAGAGDKMVSPGHNSMRLHRELLQSEIEIVPGVGHMLQYGARPEIVAAVHKMALRHPGLGFPQPAGGAPPCH